MPAHLSNQRLTWVATGRVLLDIGNETADDIVPSAEQAVTNYVPIGARWGRANGEGGARRPIEFSRRVIHASRADAIAFVWTHPTQLLAMGSGKIRVDIEDGPSFELADATMLSVVPRLHAAAGNITITEYRLTAGEMRPVANFPTVPGLPIAWQLVPIEHLDSPVIGSL